jgi:lysophospholipase L1-like esterase
MKNIIFFLISVMVSLNMIAQQSSELWITGSALSGNTVKLSSSSDHKTFIYTGALQAGELKIIDTETINENTHFLAPKEHQTVVFIGNSITENWLGTHPNFFTNNWYIGKGISGQTSSQIRSRFIKDVVNLHPTAVVINAGTNDIAENGGTYNPEATFNNITRMADIAELNGIRVILSSVLPAGGFFWNTSITDAPQKIDALNVEIKAHAETKGYGYIDYNTPLRDANGALKSGYGSDGVHPNGTAYYIMEALAKEAIGEIDNTDIIGEKRLVLSDDASLPSWSVATASSSYKVEINTAKENIIGKIDNTSSLDNVYRDGESIKAILSSNGSITVLMANNSVAKNVQVFDIAGKMIAKVHNVSKEFSFGNHLDKGVYLVKIDCDGQTIVRKVLVL